MKKVLILIIIFFNLSYSFSSEWKLSKTRTYKANNLYGYIDGGAELFLELGFKQLTVHYYSNGKSELVMDLYEMESPESALAIYLQKCGRETPIKGINARNSGDKYQIICYKGNYLIVINNSSGSNDYLQDMIFLTNSFIKEKKLSDVKVNILNLLPEKNLKKESIVIFRGPYSLSPIYTFGEGDVFQLKGQIFGVSGDYQVNKKNYTLLVIKYPSSLLASQVFNSLQGKFDKTKKILQKEKNKIIFKDHLNKYAVIELDKEIIRIKINLNNI